jgi:capsular polysaccharide biosynthesis protein
MPELINETAILKMEELSVVDQIRYMATSKVALSVTGSTSFPSLWLPRGGKVVLLMREKDQRLDASMYENIGYIEAEYYNAEETEEMVTSIISGMNSFSLGLE